MSSSHKPTLSQTFIPQNSFVIETPRPCKTIHSFPNISQGNTVRILTDEQNLWDKKSIVIKQNNRPQLYDVLNKNENVIIRNRWHLMPTDEKFTDKSCYDNIIPPTTKLPESVAPPQTAKSPEPIISLTTINLSKLIAPNGAKLNLSGRVSKKKEKKKKQVY